MWLNKNEMAYKKLITCTKITEFRNIGKFLYRVQCVWENQVVMEENVGLL